MQGISLISRDWRPCEINGEACRLQSARHSSARLLSVPSTTPHHTHCSPEPQDPCSINYFNLRYFEESESFSFILCLLVKTDCCVSLVSTRKEARWSIRFFSVFTVDDEGYVQQTNKQNWTLNSNEDKKPCVATLYRSTYEPKNVREKETTRKFLNSLDLESSFTFKIYSDYACLKVCRETLRTIDSFLEQSRSIQSIYSM